MFDDKFRLNKEELMVLEALTKRAREAILLMTTRAASGHPGGSLSVIDFLICLYAGKVVKEGNKVVISNGHVSPAVYATLAEMGFVDRDEVIGGFRKFGSIFEGHVSREVPGVVYGTGPLGIGVSVGSGIAWKEKMDYLGWGRSFSCGPTEGEIKVGERGERGGSKRVFVVMGDGEAQEGQVHEMCLFASKYELGNLTVIVDVNGVQLSDSIEKVMPINLKGMFESAGFLVVEIEGHDFNEIWRAMNLDGGSKPVVILAKTIMGKGVEFMEVDGRMLKATWHGSAAKMEQIEGEVLKFKLSEEEKMLVEKFRKEVLWRPNEVDLSKNGMLIDGFRRGEERLYAAGEDVDCRTAYGKALLDLVELNDQVVALTADLSGSVMTKFVAEKLPERHIECGIAEQNMISIAGGLSIESMIPFASTFGAFMSARAKDQVRVNDINQCNVKMVATHCGLSVGEDGPTHQVIDDLSSIGGLLNTEIIEPVDANMTDKVIRFIGERYGNFYVRMGRHKFKPITKENGEVFYDQNYVFELGKADLIREGDFATILATGACVREALDAVEVLREEGIWVELWAMSSFKHIDEKIGESMRKTGKVVVVEDHNPFGGWYSQVLKFMMEVKISVECYGLGVREYQRSGTWKELYGNVGIDALGIAKKVRSLRQVRLGKNV